MWAVRSLSFCCMSNWENQFTWRITHSKMSHTHTAYLQYLFRLPPVVLQLFGFLEAGGLQESALQLLGWQWPGRMKISSHLRGRHFPQESPKLLQSHPISRCFGESCTIIRGLKLLPLQTSEDTLEQQMELPNWNNDLQMLKFPLFTKWKKLPENPGLLTGRSAVWSEPPSVCVIISG